jgi:serine/threonine-protein kinase
MRTELALANALGERYALHEVVGQGGMAIVYRATDRRHGRDVAVKVLRDDEGAGEHAGERFRREIETAARLTHPHILPVHDSGATESLRWYVMPLVRGPSLRRRMEQQPLAPHEALRIAQQVAEALAYAHGHGVVHRDVKPENILLEEGHAVLADFGVARLVDDARLASWTRTGHVVGTPAYMSPEQGTGEQPATGAADVYALGCVLHEMLAGGPPFGAGPHGLVLMRHVNDEPPTLDQRTGVPPGVADFVRRCLAKEPAHRPTAQQASRELDQLRTASRSGAMVPVARRARWAPLAVGGALAVAAALVAAQWLGPRGPTGDGVRVAQAASPADGWIVLGEFESGGGDSLLARGVRDLLEASLAGSSVARSLSMPQLRQVARTAGWADTVRITGDRAVELARRYSVPAVVTGSIGSLGAAALTLTLQVLQTRDAEPLATISVQGPRDSLIVLVDRLGRRLREELDERPEELRRIRPLDRVTTPSVTAFDSYAAGVDASRAGKVAEGTRLLRRAVTLDTAFAAAWLGLATNWITLGQRDSAATALMRARAFPERLTITQRVRVEAQAAATLDGDVRRALRLYDELVAGDSTVIAARTNRGLLRMQVGDYEGALDDFRRAYRLLAPFVPTLGQVQLVDQAIALASLGRAAAVDSLRPLMSERWAPMVTLLVPLARADVARAGHVADSLAALGVAEPLVTPVLVASRAVAMAARGRADSADAVLAEAARAAGGADGRWYEQHRALLASGTGGMPVPVVPPADTTEPTLVLVRAALSGDRAGVARAAARLRALPPAQQRRRGRALALADAWLRGPAALATLAAGEDANDAETDRPIGPVVTALARRAGMAGIAQPRVPASEIPARMLLRFVR